eukprot:CAMPEP_0196592398 /NCGR_PEP_ID=MMETSP1081-20130531/72653_1 /TAXON_ID=36882 /ORGANISM="Pyramimonas amylifera, Strain CCMP720" /LENGTH=86 /DNA_ID=CAMNT_0041916085 /DNA_START=269 /DNA_END=529 /DNA_ORIENTATION=+
MIDKPVVEMSILVRYSDLEDSVQNVYLLHCPMASNAPTSTWNPDNFANGTTRIKDIYGRRNAICDTEETLDEMRQACGKVNLTPDL